MMETELDPRCDDADCGENERMENLNEYVAITEDLQRDLEECKGEQKRFRSEFATLLQTTKRATEIAKESFSRAQQDKCTLNENDRESLDNLRRRLSILEMEKETIHQMWQTSLKRVGALEEELRSIRNEDRATKYNEEQMEGVKEMYSEAIKSLESKLERAKENFSKNLAIWEVNRAKVENLMMEKSELEKKLSSTEREAREKQESNGRLIESLQCEADSSRIELDRAREDKLELHEKLQEARSFASMAIAKSEESKRKVAEALEIAESAIREKEAAVEGESRAHEERARMEGRLNGIVEEYTTRLDRELAAARESFERGSKKYAIEIKELKVELREKVTLLDRLEREKKLLENELEKVGRGTESLLQRSSANIVDLEEKLKEVGLKMASCQEDCKKKYEEKMEEMEARLAASSDRLRRTQLYSHKEFEQRIREADDRAKEIMERYSVLERRLARTLDDKEKLASEMRTLRHDYEREMARKDVERRLQETRTRELHDNLQTANDELEKSNSRAACLMKQIENLQRNLLDKPSAESSGIESRINQELLSRLKTLQEKFDQRTKELTQHVETHQKLCRRWKDEANALTSKFQSRTKEFRDEMSIMRKENEALNKELLVCRQQLGARRLQVCNRFDQGDGMR